MAVTKLINMINPQVLADMVSANLEAAIKFAPLATIDNTLVGRPGSTVTLPKFEYIGDAADVPEAAAIDIALLTTSDRQVTIKKAGKGVELTDESVLSGYGDPLGEAAKQLRMAITNKVDNDVIAELDGIKANMTVGDGTAVISSNLVADGLVKFGENVDGPKVLMIAATQLATLRKSEDWIKATDMGVQVLMSGVMGMIHGCQVVVSNKVKAVGGVINNYIVKPGALAIYKKRDVELEADRDIIRKTTVVTADQHYVAYLQDESKAIKLVTKA